MKPDVVISLFDDSGNLMQPWIDAGYECYLFDILNPIEGDHRGKVHRLHADLRQPLSLPCDKERIAFVSCHPPCDHLAVSGARWFVGKGLRALSVSVEMFATAAEFCEASGAPYMIENPVGVMSTYWRKPDYTYQPFHYTKFDPRDNYTKKTCLWTGGGFIMPIRACDVSLGEPDERIHKAPPGPTRAYFRSVTPQGFGRAVFEANKMLISDLV
jgi:hypothetical protein